MKLSIRKIFFNLKVSLLLLAVGVALLMLQLINISQYSDRLAALKNQHILIQKITATSLKDMDMAIIAINADLAELKLFTKLSSNRTLLDSIISSKDEQESLNQNLVSTSNSFQDSVLFWSESMPKSRNSMHERMISARNLYLNDIDVMIDYQIQLMNTSSSMAKITVLTVFFFALIIFFLYQWRLNQIYRDIHKACSVDTDGKQSDANTVELDFIFRRLSRKMPITSTSTAFLNPISGINNEKGLLTVFNAKQTNKSSSTIYVALFEIDKYDELTSKLSKGDMDSIYKKIAEILSMYEQPNDIIGHLDDNTFAFVMTRNSKDIALGDAEKIVQSIHEAIFQILQGSIKITLSGGLLLKISTKSLEEALRDAVKIVSKAKESGGDRVAQLRDATDKYR